jgi:hypothetical protein
MKSTAFFLLFLGMVATAPSCGVKGKPLPPIEPPTIGRGAPSYKRTAEEAKPQAVPSPTPEGRSR